MMGSNDRIRLIQESQTVSSAALISAICFIFYCVSSFNLNGLVEKKMVVVIPSYNNKDWYKQNLESVFSQKYSNYRVIYIDDCSPDGTGALVEEFVRKMEQQGRVTLIKNQKRCGALANHYRAVHMCDDQEIILQLDGDDWFPHENVLSYINNIYINPNIWITYGQFKRWPSGKIGYCKAIPNDVLVNSSLRNTSWTPGQLRTFYAWLFKQIKLEDMIFDGSAYPDIQGKFYATNCDPVCYLPMMEMAAERHKFIEDIIYIYNQQTPINDSKVHAELLSYSGRLIRSKKPYQRLEAPLINRFKRFEDAKVNLFYFISGHQHCEDLMAKARSIVRDLRTIVFFEYGDDHWITHCFRGDASDIVVHYSKGIVLSDVIYIYAKIFPEEYCLLCEGTFLNKVINIKDYIVNLEQTFAHVFLLPKYSPNKIGIPFVELGENIIGFRVDYGRTFFDEMVSDSLLLVRGAVFNELSNGIRFDSFSNLNNFLVDLRFNEKIILCKAG